jgi:hypothetical protein
MCTGCALSQVDDRSSRDHASSLVGEQVMDGVCNRWFEVTVTGGRWLHIVRHRWLVEPVIFVMYLTLTTALIMQLISASSAVQVADASLSVMVPIIIIKDPFCTGLCEGTFRIDCVTRKTGVSTRSIVVDAEEFNAAYQDLGCQPRAECPPP